MTEAPENGVCDYAQVWIVKTYTSGNELRGPAVHLGKFETDRDARQALADEGFSNGKFGWRKGYTDATIVKSTEYTNYRAASRPVTAAELEQTRVGDIGNRYGGISIRCIDGKPEWAIEDYDGLYWEPCPIPVFLALRALSHEGGE